MGLFRLSLEPERALVAEDRIVRRGLADDDGAGLAERADLAQMVGAFAAGLLARADRQHQVRRAPLPLSRELQCDVDEGGDARLHIRGSAAIELAVYDFGAEGIDRPVLGAKRYHVDVPAEAKRLLAVSALAAQHRDEARPLRRELVVGDVEPRRAQQIAEIVGTFHFAARRIARVHADDVPRDLQGGRDGGHGWRSSSRHPAWRRGLPIRHLRPRESRNRGAISGSYEKLGSFCKKTLRAASRAGAARHARLRSSRSVWGTGIGPMPSATISRHSRFCGMIGGTGMVEGSGVASAMGFSSPLPVTSPRRKNPL